MKKFKLLRGQIDSNQITNYILPFRTSSLNEHRLESNNEMVRWHDEHQHLINTTDEKIFVNDVKLKYNLTIWNRLKTWWKYSMSREEKINFCLLIALLFSIFSMLGYITYAHGVITEQVSKLK